MLADVGMTGTPQSDIGGMGPQQATDRIGDPQADREDLQHRIGSTPWDRRGRGPQVGCKRIGGFLGCSHDRSFSQSA